MWVSLDLSYLVLFGVLWYSCLFISAGYRSLFCHHFCELVLSASPFSLFLLGPLNTLVCLMAFVSPLSSPHLFSFFFLAPVIGWSPLPCLWVCWSCLPRDLVHCWTIETLYWIFQFSHCILWLCDFCFGTLIYFMDFFNWELLHA